MKTRLAITSILFFALQCLSLAQDSSLRQTIRGEVTDKATGQPIPGASVIVEQTQPLQGASTDLNGRFRIADVAIGRPVLRISMIGYAPVKLGNLVLSSSKELVINVSLESQAVMGNAVEVVARSDKDKALNEMSIVSSRTFSVDEAQRYAGSFGDPARLATSFAGVVAGNDQRNDIVVRGNTPLGILWRLEGIDIPSPSHFSGSGTSGGAVSVLNTNVMANSDFGSGAFAAEYGNASSGVFDVKLRNGNNEKHEFTGQVGFNGFELGAEGPLNKNGASYLISYRYSTLGLFDAVGISFVEGGVPKYQDLSVKLHFPHKKGSTSVFAIAGTSDIHFVARLDSSRWSDEPNTREDLKNGSDVAVVGASRTWFSGPKHSLRLTLAATGNRFRTAVDSITPQYEAFRDFRSNITEQKALGTLVWSAKWSSKLSMRSGFIATISDNRADVNVYRKFLQGYLPLVDFQGNGTLLQGYSQLQYKPIPELSINAGFHAMHFDINNKFALEPRLSARYQRNNQSFSLGYGMHSRVLPINVYLRETRLADGKLTRTNTGLDFLRAEHYVLGYDIMPTEHFRIKAEFYYQNLNNVGVQAYRPDGTSVLNIGADFGDVIGPDSLQSTGTGRNQGVELTLEKFFSHNYYFLITGSLYDSKYKGSDGVERNTAFNNQYAVNVLAGKEFPVGKNKQNVFILSGRAVLTGGMWVSPIDLEASRAIGTEVRINDLAYTEQLPDYRRFDIRFGFRKNKKNYTEEYGIDFQNVLNRKNLFTRSYNPISETIVDNFQVGFFPMALYRITF